MSTRNRNREEEQNTQNSGSTPEAGSNTSRGDEVRDRARRLLELGDEVRDRARRLLELGDETISHALSQNSERFLEQNRQQGGQ